jgi:uncharacterized phage-like protein YoqJ
MKNPTMLKLKDTLLEWIEILIKEECAKRFISGGALGTDQCAFWCVHIMKQKYPDIKNIVAIPFKNQDKVWTLEQKQWYQKMLRLADEVINVEEIEKYKVNDNTPLGEFSAAKMQKRNEYMVDNSSKMIAVFDGSKGGTANCVKYAHYSKRGSGMMYVQIYPNHDFQVDTRWIY